MNKGHYDCGGILLISFSFLGQFTNFSFNWKQFPVTSLYCNNPTFSGVGYTNIVLISGTNTYTKNTPIAKLRIKTGIFINFKNIYIVETHFQKPLFFALLFLRICRWSFSYTFYTFHQFVEVFTIGFLLFFLFIESKYIIIWRTRSIK
jgi:hypothetical protein